MEIFEIPQLILLFGLVIAVGFLLLYVRKVRPLSNPLDIEDKSQIERLRPQRGSGKGMR